MVKLLKFEVIFIHYNVDLFNALVIFLVDQEPIGEIRYLSLLLL